VLAVEFGNKAGGSPHALSAYCAHEKGLLQAMALRSLTDLLSSILQLGDARDSSLTWQFALTSSVAIALSSLTTRCNFAVVTCGVLYSLRVWLYSILMCGVREQ